MPLIPPTGRMPLFAPSPISPQAGLVIDPYEPFAAGRAMLAMKPPEAFASVAPLLLEQFRIVPSLENLLEDDRPGRPPRRLPALERLRQHSGLAHLSIGSEHSTAVAAKNALDGMRLSACGKQINGELNLEHLRDVPRTALYDSLRNGDPDTVFNLSLLAWQGGLGSCGELAMAAALIMKAQAYPHALDLIAVSPRPMADDSIPDHSLLRSEMGGVIYYFDPLMHLLKFNRDYGFPTPSLHFRTIYGENCFEENFRFTSADHAGKMHLHDIGDLDHRSIEKLFVRLGSFTTGQTGPSFQPATRSPAVSV